MKTAKWLCLWLVLLVVMTACCMAPEKQLTFDGLNTTLWEQTSTEYTILATQTYARARASVEKALLDPEWTAATEQVGKDFKNLPPAIIVDVDETVLNTTGFQTELVLEQKQFSLPQWNNWVKTASARRIPGAREFLLWAAEQKKIAVFYVTNRDASVEPWTRQNLVSEGFPVADGLDAVLCKGEYGDLSSDKGGRRRHVCKGYRVLLLAGDNLGDFISGAKDTPENRAGTAGKYVSFWAEKWVVLPNPIYGSWESALYDFDRTLTDREVLDRKIERLKGYKQDSEIRGVEE